MLTELMTGLEVPYATLIKAGKMGPILQERKLRHPETQNFPRIPAQLGAESGLTLPICRLLARFQHSMGLSSR